MFKTVLIFVLFASVFSVRVSTLFDAFAGADALMDKQEFGDFWLHFDQNGDEIVSKLEFDSGWKNAHFPDSEHSPMFFLEMDRIPDEMLTRDDFDHMFNIFESDDGDGGLDKSEFLNTFNRIFKND